MLKIQQHTHVPSFLKLVRFFLEKNEAENNLPLGLLENGIIPKPKDIFISVQQDDEVVFIAMKTLRNFIVNGDPTYVSAVAEFLFTKKIDVDGFIGNKDLVLALAKKYQVWSDKSWSVKLNTRIHKLATISPLEYPSGSFRNAAPKDESLIAQWIAAFNQDIGEPMDFEKVKIMAKNIIEKKSLFVWEDEEVVSMAKYARPSRNGGVVNLVFTPKKFRGRGYATACVASLSEHILKEKKFCTLYTDLANPISNKIYYKIGYRPVVDTILVEINK